mmetsp:Transcript_109896/g.310946  ORF Transcript_109896/g.310946 Transcript_109896/m.310946 type:complete len:215 (+) Transcript_109896:154-798(+)
MASTHRISTEGVTRPVRGSTEPSSFLRHGGPRQSSTFRRAPGPNLEVEGPAEAGAAPGAASPGSGGRRRVRLAAAQGTRTAALRAWRGTLPVPFFRRPHVRPRRRVPAVPRRGALGRAAHLRARARLAGLGGGGRALRPPAQGPARLEARRVVRPHRRVLPAAARQQRQAAETEAPCLGGGGEMSSSDFRWTRGVLTAGLASQHAAEGRSAGEM